MLRPNECRKSTVFLLRDKLCMLIPIATWRGTIVIERIVWKPFLEICRSVLVADIDNSQRFTTSLSICLYFVCSVIAIFGPAIIHLKKEYNIAGMCFELKSVREPLNCHFSAFKMAFLRTIAASKRFFHIGFSGDQFEML